MDEGQAKASGSSSPQPLSAEPTDLTGNGINDKLTATESAQDVLQDWQDRYSAGPVSPAEFFAPIELLERNDDVVTSQPLIEGRLVTSEDHFVPLDHPVPQIVIIPPEDGIVERKLVPQRAVDRQEVTQTSTLNEDPQRLEENLGGEKPELKRASRFDITTPKTSSIPTSSEDQPILKKAIQLEQFQDAGGHDFQASFKRRVRSFADGVHERQTEKKLASGPVSDSQAVGASASWTTKDALPKGGWRLKTRCFAPSANSNSTNMNIESSVDVVFVYLYNSTRSDKSDPDADLNLFRHKRDTANPGSTSKKIRRAITRDIAEYHTDSQGRGQFVNWLQDEWMLPKHFPGARIITVGFDIAPALSAFPNFDTAATQLNDHLSKLRPKSQAPIVFLSHSLGAMFVLQAFGATAMKTTSTASTSPILPYTAGLIAFSYPVPTTDSRSKMLATLYGVKATDKILSDLSGSPPTERLSKWMRTALSIQSSRSRDTSKGPPRTPQEQKKMERIEIGFPIYQVYSRNENQDSKGSLNTFLGAPVRKITFEKDLSNAIKFATAQDADFLRLISSMRSCLHTHHLLRATAAGDVNEVENLIGQNINLNVKDRWSQTALQIAVRRNDERVVNALLRTNIIEPNIRDTKLNTPLHYAVRIGNEHMITNLIHHGADPNVENSKKRTPRDFAENHKSRKHIAKLLSSRLVSGPDQSLRSKRIGTGSTPDTEDGTLACKSFQVTITEIYASDASDKHWSVNVSIWALLYGSKSLEYILGQIRPQAVESQTPACVWIHVPENNMIWIEDLFAKLGLHSAIWQGTRRSVTESLRNRTITPHVGNDSIRSIFLPYLSYEANFRQYKRTECIQSADEGYRRRQLVNRTFSRATTRVASTIEEASPKPGNHGQLLLQVPSALGHKPHTSRNPNLDDSDSDVSEEFDLGNTDDLEEEEKALIRHYLNNPPALHVRRTLDQYYYHMLENTKERDIDQVVSRWFQSVKAQSRHNILMVDQLWLWTTCQGFKKPKPDLAEIASRARKQQKMGSNTDGQDLPKEHKDHYVISCFPSRTGTGHTLHRTVDDLRQFVLDPHGRKRDPIQKPEDLISRILQTCFSAFDRLQDVESLRFFQMFEDSIGSIDDKETRLFREFQRGSTRLLELNSANKYYETKKSALLINLLDIREEIKLLVEVKDIRDEINIILSILNIQRSLVEQMSHDDGTTHGLLQNTAVENVIKADIDDFTKLDGQARSIQEKLNTLMDLKQKAANAWEAREARETAVVASKQGNTVMVFTVVTIIFLPLSFLSSFFTIGIAAFPKDLETGETNWPLGFLMALLFGISLCVSIPLILFALNMEYCTRKITEVRRNHLSIIAIYLIGLLPPLGTSDKTNTFRKRWTQRLQNYRDEYIKWRDEYIREEAGDDDLGGLADLIRKLGPTDPFPLDATSHSLFSANGNVEYHPHNRKRARELRIRKRETDDETLVDN